MFGDDEINSGALLFDKVEIGRAFEGQRQPFKQAAFRRENLEETTSPIGRNEPSRGIEIQAVGTAQMVARQSAKEKFFQNFSGAPEMVAMELLGESLGHHQKALVGGKGNAVAEGEVLVQTQKGSIDQTAKDLPGGLGGGRVTWRGEVEISVVIKSEVVAAFDGLALEMADYRLDRSSIWDSQNPLAHVGYPDRTVGVELKSGRDSSGAGIKLLLEAREDFPN